MDTSSAGGAITHITVAMREYDDSSLRYTQIGRQRPARQAKP
jgi:hypothetical protein